MGKGVYGTGFRHIALFILSPVKLQVPWYMAFAAEDFRLRPELACASISFGACAFEEDSDP